MKEEVKTTDSNSLKKSTRRLWNRKDWDTLLQLMQLLVGIAVLFNQT